MEPLDEEIARVFKLAKLDGDQEGKMPAGFETRILAMVRREEAAEAARAIPQACRGVMIWSCGVAAAAAILGYVQLQFQWELFTMRGVEKRLAHSAVWAQWQ